MPKKILNTYTDAEAAFITRVTGLPLSAAAVRAALRLLAEKLSWEDSSKLFLPRERGANLRNLTTEQKSAAAKNRWAKADRRKKSQ